MYRLATVIVILLSLVLPPLLAVMVTGHALMPYMDFPFLTHPADHGAFSYPVWWSMVVFIIAVTVPFIIHALRYPVKEMQFRDACSFPAWGWTAVIFLLPFWVLAWNRFDWFIPLQVYTFTPLWLCYIVIVNALTTRRKGSCLLTNRPFYLIGLSLLSSGFWWYYEFLNGFIRNWHYAGLEGLTIGEYVFHSSIAYATVLPAVISTIELLNTIPRMAQPFMEFGAYRLHVSRAGAVTVWIGGCAVLGLAAVYPEQLFMCVWMAPLFILVGARRAMKQTTVFALLEQHDWRPVILPATAALICGFFWELWNFRSYAHWEYNIPLVDGFHVFEMPVVGYAGYLPFGMVCLAIGELVEGTDKLFDA